MEEPRFHSNLKSLADAENVSIQALSKAINYRFESVRTMYNDEMSRYPSELLAKLCAYFGVTIDKLLVLDDKKDA